MLGNVLLTKIYVEKVKVIGKQLQRALLMSTFAYTKVIAGVRHGAGCQ
jgi:hypothetical protein